MNDMNHPNESILDTCKLTMVYLPMSQVLLEALPSCSVWEGRFPLVETCTFTSAIVTDK
ncbi:hypothetical protein M404DRAFT_997750 [Pisolithus tinctorius Marx 270]|uniref:Uncharacterized protein n=1 Tax=Pisolithus tinctorius Marx 270 TaxID=870435 RepID=A0A0C3PGQ1_PISTI|nr:hypothetical protein M404DRAFT_997750 [Pisolithus tinctorius Marx 270]